MSNKVLGLISCNYNNEEFGKLTEERALAALPFGGRYRLLDFALSNMVKSGIRTIGLITPYYYRSIMDHVGAGKEWSLNRKSGGMFILPGSIYGLRTRRAAFLLRDIMRNREFLDRSHDDYVLLSASHNIYNMDFRSMIEAHRKSGCGITMLYKTIDDADAHAGVYLDLNLNGDRVSDMKEEGHGKAHLFMGSFVIDRELLLNFFNWYEHLGHMDVLDIIKDNLKNISIGAYAFEGYLGQVHDIRNYMQCSMDLLKEPVRQELFGGKNKIYTKIQDNPPAKYTGKTVAHNSLIPTGCIVNGTVENSILFRGVQIGEGAVVRNCVIMQKCVIQPGAVLENVICDKFVTIGSNNKLSGTPSNPLVIPKSSEI
jgi:glucose-1-phosphate adenylyltransferase